MDSIRELNFGFYLILKMTVDEKQIFPLVSDSKQKVVTLPELTSMMTVRKGITCNVCGCMVYSCTTYQILVASVL